MQRNQPRFCGSARGCFSLVARLARLCGLLLQLARRLLRHWRLFRHDAVNAEVFVLQAAQRQSAACCLCSPEWRLLFQQNASAKMRWQSSSQRWAMQQVMPVQVYMLCTTSRFSALLARKHASAPWAC